MATFTSIPEDETAFISIDHRNRISKIQDNIYGGFTE